MNANYRRVPTRFGPEIRFEARLAPPGPFWARQQAEFERLKARLLPARGPQFEAQLRRAAAEAAALAWVTRYPLLVFPVLFEEIAEAALLQAARQEQISQRSRELLAA